MKKFAWIIAALSLCASTFVACSDDKDDDKKLSNGEVCETADECDSNYCSADKKCADAPKAKGDVCTASSECAEGLYCAKDGDAKKCADKLADAASCDSAEACKSGKCEGADGAKVCVAAEAPAAKAQKGESCVSKDCDADLVCDGKEEAKVCKVAEGKACVESADCLAKDYCAGEANAKVCTAKKSAGAECSVDDECLYKVCKKENDTDAKGVCGTPADASAKKANGEACSAPTECKSGLCDSVCKGKPVDADCDSNDVCESNLCSDNNKCVAADSKAAKGEKCGMRSVCDTDLECSAEENGKGVCKVAKDKTCANNDECITNYCNASNVCADLPEDYCGDDYVASCGADPDDATKNIAYACVEHKIEVKHCSDDCIGNVCAEDVESCDYDSQCVAANGDGYYCVYNSCKEVGECSGENESCPDGYVCKGDSDRKCMVDKVEKDASCVATVQCPAGTYCGGTDPKCVDKLADNQACLDSEDCVSGKCEGADGAKVCVAAAAQE